MTETSRIVRLGYVERTTHNMDHRRINQERLAIYALGTLLALRWLLILTAGR
jgi:hypothetical protein